MAHDEFTSPVFISFYKSRLDSRDLSPAIKILFHWNLSHMIFYSPPDDSVKFYIRGRAIRLHRPTEFKDVNPDGRAPEEKLKLDWVYLFH